jgi:hypothetical protein
MTRRCGLIHNVLNQHSIGETVSVVTHHNQNIIFREWLPLLATNLPTQIFQFTVVTRLRARFVCQGFSQVKDVSYWESFSPVVSFTPHGTASLARHPVRCVRSLSHRGNRPYSAPYLLSSGRGLQISHRKRIPTQTLSIRHERLP